jgi:hypothetical protein
VKTRGCIFNNSEKVEQFLDKLKKLSYNKNMKLKSLWDDYNRIERLEAAGVFRKNSRVNLKKISVKYISTFNIKNDRYFEINN